MAKFEVDAGLVRQLAALLEETGLTEIEYENGDQRIRVGRGGAPAIAAAPAPTPIPAPASGPSSDGPPAGAVTSPLVGTAYTKPDPSSNPYVKPGDKVTPGQTLLIIEAMKVMNPIAAPHGGTVEEVRVGDGQPVEFGEVLMIVR
jgi:acetyl-CoA carboxylase biotin carboxyl carrier protein